MADRIVKVGLVLQASQFYAEAEKVRAKTAQIGTEADKLGQKKQAFETLGRSALIMGTALAAGIGVAVSRFAEFDKQMSAVQAATHESAQTMGLLRDAAMDAGASTVFTATESAEAIEELSKAGISASDVLSGALAGSLDLASAGAIGVGRAAEIAATAITQFNLEGSDVPHVADLFAAAAGKAQGGVEDMAQAFGQAGLVASQTGLSLEETTGTLAAFASAGLLGSDAGTSLRTMLLRLTPQSKEAADEMTRLHFSAFDTNGEFIGMEKLAAQVTKSFGGMNTEARNASAGLIFGQDAIRGFNVLLDEGATGIGDWIDNVDDVGYAAETARIRLDNLSGDVEKLGGAFDTALIRGGGGANDTLRTLVQSATVLVDAIGSLPAPVTNAGLVVGVLAAGVAGVGGAALLAVPRVVAFKTSLDTLKVSVGTAARAISGFGLAAAGITIALGNIVEHQAAISGAAADFADSLDKSTGAVTDYTRALTAKKLAESGAFDVAKEVGVGQKELTDAIVEGGDEYDRVMKKFNDSNTVGTAFTGLAFRAGNAAKGISELRDGLERSERGFKDTKVATDGLADSTEEATAKTEALQQATEAATEAQEKYLAEVAGSDAAFVDLGGAYDNAMAKAQELAKSTGESAGAVGDALDGMVDAAQVSTGEYIAELQKQVDAQNGWEANMILIAARVPAAMLDELRELGPAGAQQVQLLTTMTDEELGKTVELWQQRGAEATGAFAATLADPATVTLIQGAAAQLGQDAADEIAGKLAAGTSTVEQIMQDYGLKIEGIRPTFHVDADTATAAADVDKFMDYYGTLRGTIEYRALMPDLNGAASGNGQMGTFATGGYTGPGTKYQVAGVVHAGEFVFPQDITSRYRRFFEYLMSGGNVPGYAGGGYVRGMETQYATPSYSPNISISQPSPRSYTFAPQFPVQDAAEARRAYEVARRDFEYDARLSS